MFFVGSLTFKMRAVLHRPPAEGDLKAPTLAEALALDSC
jgi:hypothetical protein